MNREELRAALKAKGIKERFYSLDGPAIHSESFSIVPDGGLMKVVYKERAEFEDVQAGLSEEEACELVYQLLKKEFNWHDEK